jgi:hypothetical protein
VDWGLALRWLAGADAAGCGTATFTANGFFNSKKKAPHPIMDIASVAYTWLAIVHGNPYGEPPWNDEVSRTSWLSAKKSRVGVAEVEGFLEGVYSLAGARSMSSLETLYNWCVEVSLDVRLLAERRRVGPTFTCSRLTWVFCVCARVCAVVVHTRAVTPSE